MASGRPEWTAVEENVRIGLDWLTTPGQPDNAVMSQFGRSTHVGGFLRVECSAGHFGPDGGYDGVGLVVFALHNPDTTKHGPEQPVPFTEAEVVYLRGLVEAHPKVEVQRTWNGAGTHSFSVAVTGLPVSGPALAYRNYSNGCPVHGGVFCGERARWGDSDRDDDETRCTGHSDGHAALIEPEWVTVEMPSPPSPPEPTDNDRNLRAVQEALDRIRPILADAGFHPDTIVAGRRGDIIDGSGGLSFAMKDGYGVALPAEAIVEIVQLLSGVGAL